MIFFPFSLMIKNTETQMAGIPLLQRKGGFFAVSRTSGKKPRLKVRRGEGYKCQARELKAESIKEGSAFRQVFGISGIVSCLPERNQERRL